MAQDESTALAKCEEEKRLILKRSWYDIFWMVGAGFLAAVGWRMADRIFFKGERPLR